MFTDEPRPKTLPPSMRTKGRYLIFEVISENPIEYQEIRDSFWNSITNFLGELGTSEAHPVVLKNLYDIKSQRGVIKCRHDMIEQVRTSLSLITMVGESRAVVRIDGVTGTIKSARNKYLGMRDLRSFS
ncbi:MAG: Rpp14/Pop5 family protein [Candidatus Aenigmatarchaeota archaeon]